jgi:hypothetical protein
VCGPCMRVMHIPAQWCAGDPGGGFGIRMRSLQRLSCCHVGMTY